MSNVKMERKGTQLVITVDLSEQGQPSASGKTLVVASTHGNAQVPGDPSARLGLNLFRYRSA